MKKTKIIAHRGYSAKYPENTLVAFRKARDLGADGIECDIHESEDGELIIHHDYFLGHTDNGTGLIHEKTARYLASLDAGSWFQAQYKNENIPFLEAVLAEFGTSITYEIELKGFTQNFIDKIITLVQKYNLVSTVEFTSPHLFVLAKLKQLLPEAKIGLFAQEFPSWMGDNLGQQILLNTMQVSGSTVAHFPLAMITKDLISNMHRNNLLVHAADCNTPDSLKQAFSLYVDQVSTNEVETALEIREELG